MAAYIDTTIDTHDCEDEAATLRVSASPGEFGGILLHAGIPMISSTMLNLTVGEAATLIHALSAAIDCLVDAEG